jgi:hypothetical protein
MLRGGGDVRDVPADPEAEQEERRHRHAAEPLHRDGRDADDEETGDERRRPADTVDERPDDEDEHVHPEHVRADDRKDVCLGVVVDADDDVAGEVHHGDHHGLRRECGEHRRDDSRSADDLPEGRCVVRLGRIRGRDGRGDAVCDPARIGPDPDDHAHRDDADAGGDEPWNRQRMRSDLAIREERRVDRRAEDRAEHGADEDVRDAARTTLGRIHVARCGADQLCDSGRRADQHEPHDDGEGRAGVRRESGDEAADAAERVADCEHRDAAEPIHRPTGRHGRQPRGCKEDRGAQSEQPLDPRDEDERQR